MVVIHFSLLTTLSLAACYAAAQTTGPCPSGEELIQNNKCCPGPAVGGDGGKTYCCVTGSGSIGITSGGVSGCKAQNAVDDPDYDAKVSAALGSTTTTATTPPTGGATVTPSASIIVGSGTTIVGSTTITGPAATSGPGSGSGSGSSPATGAAVANGPGLVAAVALAALLPVWYWF